MAATLTETFRDHPALSRRRRSKEYSATAVVFLGLLWLSLFVAFASLVALVIGLGFGARALRGHGHSSDDGIWLAVVFIAMGQGGQGRRSQGSAQQKVSQVVHFGRTPRV